MALGCIQVENVFPLNVAAGALGGAGYPALKASKMSGVKKQNKRKKNPTTKNKPPNKQL